MDWLFKWQTFLGAALGGIMGLLSALIVAHSARRREEISAAMVLVGNLVKVIASQALLKKSEDEGVPAVNRHLWLAEKLTKFRPTLSPMFEASVARVMPVNGSLACHLELFRLIYSDVEMILERIAGDGEAFKRTGVVPRPKEQMSVDAERATSGFDTAAQHAICAEHLLSKLILSKTPTFNRIRMLLWSTEKERSCTELLRTGTPKQAMKEDCLHATHSGNR